MTAPALLDEAPKRRAKPIPREAWRQEKAVAFATAAIACPHTILAFDRSQARGEWSHRFEAKRGVRAGTPDTLTIARDGERTWHVWVEWKAEANTPNVNQFEGIALLKSLGDVATWCVSIEGFFNVLDDLGIPMVPGAHVMALRYDGLVDSRIAKAEGAVVGVKKKSRARKPEPRFAGGKRFVGRATAKGIRF